MAAIEMKSVKSSNIDSIGYSPETKTLRVAFKNGSVYTYEGVDAEKHQALMSADSVGSHFNAHIKGGGHKFTKG